MLHVEQRLEGSSPHTAPPVTAEKVYSCLCFGYAAMRPETGTYGKVAEMTLAVHSPQRVELRHRKVELDWRHQHGIGPFALNQVESTLRRHVENTGLAVEVFANLSQYDVLKFLTTAGYEPRTKKDRALLADITEGLKTGRYVIEEQTYGADDRYLLIFEVIDGVRMAEPIRLSLKKMFVPSASAT